MPLPTRRLIRLPAGLASADVDKLADAFLRAAALQRKLAAKSPYVLDITGDPRPTDEGFIIEHEPAAPLDQQWVIHPAAPTPEDTLVQLTAALYRALGSAHAGDAGRPLTHGGICPGVIVTDSAGIWKLTDFGIAPAICTVLGAEAYLNLAVAPDPTDPTLSGVWTILSADESERDDRLCAFIDPEKYGRAQDQGDKALTSFEAGSDVIAAAFILHLLAEGHHPYFFSDPQAHRFVEMSRMMAMERPTAARRKDLREAAPNSPAAIWCDAIAKALTRVPTDRPSASEIAHRFDPFVPVLDAETIARGRDKVKAQQWLIQVEPLTAAKNWDSLAPLLDRTPDLAYWPTDLAARRDALVKQLNDHRAEQARLAEIKARTDAAAAWLNTLRPLVTAEDWDAAHEAIRTAPPMQDTPVELRTEVAQLAKRVKEALERIALERAVAADHGTARQWYDALARAVGESRWSDASTVLLQKPKITHWPEDVLENAPLYEEEVNRQVEAIESARRKMEEEHFAALEWFQRAEAAAAKDHWEEVLNILSETPRLEHWPAGVRESAAKLKQRARLDLGDEIQGQLEAQTALVQSLARGYIEKIVAEKLGAFIDHAFVAINVTAVEWTAQLPSANASAHATARFSHASIKGDDSGINLLINVQTENSPRALDDDGKVAAAIVDYVSKRLHSVQQTAVLALSAFVKSAYFPHADISAPLKQLTASANAMVAPRGNGQANDAFESTIRWNARELKWTLADAPALASRLTALAVKDAIPLAIPKITATSNTLSRCAGLLAIELTPAPQPPALPLSTLHCHGKLVIRTGPSTAPQLLQTVAFTLMDGNKLALVGELSEAESALATLVIAAQNASRQAISDELESRINDADVKARITPSIKKIKHPTPQITFDIAIKTGGQLTITGSWNDEAFVYQVPKASLETLARLLAPPPEPVKPPPPPPPPPPKPKPPEPKIEKPVVPKPAEPQKPAPKPDAPVKHEKPAPPDRKPEPPPRPSPRPQPAAESTPSSKRGLFIGGGIAVVVVIGIVGYLLSGKSKTPPKPIDEPLVVNNTSQRPPVTDTIQKPPVADTTQKPPVIDTTPKPPIADTTTKPPVTDTTIKPPPADTTQKPPPPPPPPTPTKIAFDIITKQQVDKPFDVTLKLLDQHGKPISAKTAIHIQLTASGTGMLSGKTTLDIATGTQSLTIEKIAYNKVETALRLMATSADKKFVAESEPFAVAAAPAPPKPTPTPEELARSKSLANLVQKSVAAGHVALTTTQLAELDALGKKWPEIASDNAVKAALNWKTRLPRIVIPEGYVGDADANVGCPPRLTRDGVDFARVNIPPTAAIWNELAKLKLDAPLFASLHAQVRNADRPWRLFYIASTESSSDGKPVAVDSFDDAQSRARAVGLQLPTTDEWLLAALTIDPRSADMFGGLYEWCATPADEKSAGHWAIGGLPLSDTLRAKLPQLAPPDSTNRQAALDWLAHPLVSQPRIHGDGRTTYRTVLHVTR